MLCLHSFSINFVGIRSISYIIFLLASIIGKASTSMKVNLTMYWVPYEEDFILGSDTALKTCTGEILANVSNSFAEALRLEGSGILRNGQVLNLSYCNCNGTFSCFASVTAPLGSRDNPLEPYLSIAANGMGFGKLLHVKEMDGWILPNGKRHNGCVRVDDTCPGCSRNHIDFFVWNQTNYDEMIMKYPVTSVHINGKKWCKPLQYE